MTAPRCIWWVIYDHPKDMPEHFVARRWVDLKPTEGHIISPTLDALRQLLALRGMAFFCPRSPGDDPVITETWFDPKADPELTEAMKPLQTKE